MMITRNNYEQYFLDFYENSLDEIGEQLLYAFLEENPDLKQEFESFRLISLQEDSAVVLPDKAFLKKQAISRENANEFFAAYLEGDLSASQKSEVLEFVSDNPQCSRDFELMQKTRLHADTQIKFPGKSTLKHHNIIPLYKKILFQASVAAAVLVLAGLFFFHSEENTGTLALSSEPLIGAKIKPIKINKGKGINTSYPAKNINREPASSQKQTPALPQPLETGRIQGRPTEEIGQPVHLAVNMEKRTEFAYWSHRLRQEEFQDEPVFEAMPADNQSQASFTSLAFNEIQRNLNPDSGVPSDRGFSLRKIAGKGIAGITNLLNINKNDEENGRLVQLAIGDIFEYERK